MKKTRAQTRQSPRRARPPTPATPTAAALERARRVLVAAFEDHKVTAQLAALREALGQRRARLQDVLDAFLTLPLRRGPWQDHARQGLAALADGDDARAAAEARAVGRSWATAHLRRGTLRAPGRPAGRRNSGPRLVRGHSRATHELLARHLPRPRQIWPGMQLFHNLESPIVQSHFDPETLALLHTIFQTYATPLKVLRRIEQVFRPTS